jgi:hypothetical protein
VRDVCEHFLELALHGVPAPDGLLTRDIAARQLFVHLRLFPAFSRQNFKFFPLKLRTNQSFTDLCVFLHFRAKIFKFFPAKTRIQSVIYSLPIPPLPFTCVRDEIFNFPAKTQIQVQSTIYGLPIPSLPFTCVSAKILNFSPPKLRFNQSFTAYLFYLCLFPAFAPKFPNFSR